MKTVQLKLENIRSTFENHQATFRNLKDKHVKPAQFVVPPSGKAIRPRVPFFSPKPGKVSYIDLF